MPIISNIGARSLKVRAIYTAMYLLLLVGGITMIYPFCLMISGSFKSETDFLSIDPYPKFWLNDHILFQKYAETKYNLKLDNISVAWQESVGSLRNIEPPEMTDYTMSILDDFLAWRDTANIPIQWYSLGHSHGENKTLPQNERLFRKRLMEIYDGDVTLFSRELSVFATRWSNVSCPQDFGPLRSESRKIEGYQATYQDFKLSRPSYERNIINLDSAFCHYYVQPTYATIAEYNEAHGTEHNSFADVFLSTNVPLQGLARSEWEQFVRREMNPYFIKVRVDDQVNEMYRSFLKGRYDSLSDLNRRHETQYDAWEQVVCSTGLPKHSIEQVDWSAFLSEGTNTEQDGLAGRVYRLDSTKIYIHGPRQDFEAFVAQRRSVEIDEIRPLSLPIKTADWHDMQAHSRALRWEFTTRNYKQVAGFIFLHGRGAINTIIYCSMAICAALIVNPLAAYALSRYRPPSQYTILLFCMLTMSFPSAVVIIPNFLLLKRFPLWQLVTMVVSFFVLVWILSKLLTRLPDWLRAIIAAGGAVLIGFCAVPMMLSKPHVSLLNTFWALVMPTMANGYYIFLLKGFFDSLPRELYEAADIDGASEWTKFWQLTMNLSKPILAIIALNAFNTAYSAFMIAVIIIPDRSMWTMMIWIYQLMSTSHISVVYAALVIAAIPTFLVFVLCQSFIIRGIVIPTEK
jgi:ABC-type glycerol-3-phosphate transport system permease component